MNGDTTPGSIWIKAYTTDGFQVSLTLPALTVSDAMRHLDDVRAAGLLTMMPEAVQGELIETITMCVRRETVNKNDDTVPVIDCYFNGGKFKWVTIYLDDRDQLEEFEQHSGLTVRSMPLYASQAPLQAGERATAKFEIACRPFVAVKVPHREKEVNGTKQMTYKFARYAMNGAAKPAPEPAPAPLPAHLIAWTKEQRKAWVAYLEDNGWHIDQIKAALGVSLILDYTGTQDDANVAIDAYAAKNDQPEPTDAPLSADDATQLTKWAKSQYKMSYQALCEALGIDNLLHYTGSYDDAVDAVNAARKAVTA